MDVKEFSIFCEKKKITYVMGNKKNRENRNRRKANNWRGIMKTRKANNCTTISSCKSQGKSFLRFLSKQDQQSQHGNESEFIETDDYNRNNMGNEAEAFSSCEPDSFVETDDCNRNNMTHDGAQGKHSQFSFEETLQIQPENSTKIEMDYIGIDETDGTKIMNEIQMKNPHYSSFLSFNFDDWIETDNDYIASGKDQGTHEEPGCSYNWLQRIDACSSNNNIHSNKHENSNRPIAQIQPENPTRIEMDYIGIDESDGTKIVNEIQIKNPHSSSFLSFNFDDWIETDNDYIASGKDQGTLENEFENNYRSESGCSNENQYDNVEDREQIINEENENEPFSTDSLDETQRNDDSNIQYPASASGPENQAKLTGRRIVDIGFLFEQMKAMSIYSGECDFHNMEFIKETRMGLRSILYFRCAECDFCQKVYSCDKNDDSLNVNQAATLGITSIGLGFYHLEEFCAHLDIPCMSSSTFDTENKKLQNDWWELAKYHEAQALKEEKALAIARGDVDSKGNALLTGIIDGSWGKRSYGKGFSSLSGFAAIIGKHTKKVIYSDVKNKYCHVCKVSYTKTCPPNQHDCNINFDGPSSGMETAIIIEGIQSCELAGVRFNKIISDGDSSTFKEIRDLGFYKNPDVTVVKRHCVNHIFRNFRSNEISKGIRMAAHHWRESDINMIDKLNNLERDCLNAPYHYFGNHDNCNTYFCQKTTTAESNETISLLKSDGLFYEILKLCNTYFASNTASLIENNTNNPAEELNNVIAKNIAGKRINYFLAGSYKGRCGTSSVQYNTKGHAGSEFHKFKFGNSLGCSLLLKMENSRIEHYARNAVATQIKPRTKIAKDKPASIRGYGGETPDMSERAFEVAKQIELAKLDENRVNRDLTHSSTVGQRRNPEWFEVRRKIVNSTDFGRILYARSPKSYKNFLDDMLYKTTETGKSAEILHQRLYEPDALKIFSSKYKDYNLEETGVFIDKELSFLCASPSRLYGNDSIVIVKCPVKAFRKTVDEAIGKKLLQFWEMKDGNVCIKAKSNWLADIQGQLHITGRQFAYLVVWLGENQFKIEKVERDSTFWINMTYKLTFFFNEVMLKELVDPRRSRKMSLREHDPQTNTFN